MLSGGGVQLEVRSGPEGGCLVRVRVLPQVGGPAGGGGLAQSKEIPHDMCMTPQGRLGLQPRSAQKCVPSLAEGSASQCASPQGYRSHVFD